MVSFHDLKEIIDVLANPYYVPHPAKVDLVELLEDVLELEGKKSSEEAVATLKDTIRNKLKNEMSSEMKQKINKLEQLEVENKDLQTKKDIAERLSKSLEHAKKTTQNENIELKAEINKLTIQIWQLQQKETTLEAQNKTIEQSKERVVRITTAIAVGLAIYITLEHTTKLDMWLMISIAVVPALIATGIALRPSALLNGAQELQEIANER